jgi:hypothetical protein
MKTVRQSTTSSTSDPVGQPQRDCHCPHLAEIRVGPPPPQPAHACVTVTAPANKLIATLANDGCQTRGPHRRGLESLPQTAEDMSKEERAAKAKRGKPTVSDPGGLGV